MRTSIAGSLVSIALISCGGGGDGGEAVVSASADLATKTVIDPDVRIESQYQWSSFSRRLIADVDHDGRDDVVYWDVNGSTNGICPAAAIRWLPGGLLAGTIDLEQSSRVLFRVEAGTDCLRDASLVDVDGDHVLDLVVGLPSVYAFSQQAKPGRVLVFRGPLGASSATVADATATLVGKGSADGPLSVLGAGIESYFGEGVAAIGDINGDGHVDLFVGRTGLSSADFNAPEGRIVLGPLIGAGSVVSAVPPVKLVRPYYLNDTGVVAAEDFNKDGLPDIVFHGVSGDVVWFSPFKPGDNPVGVRTEYERFEKYAQSRVALADLDRDGQSEVLVDAVDEQMVDAKTTRVHQKTFLRRPSTFGLQTVGELKTASEYLIHWGYAGLLDATGDGSPELVRSQDDSCGWTDCGWTVISAPFDASAKRVRWAVTGATAEKEPAVGGDFNGDGFADVLLQARGGEYPNQKGLWLIKWGPLDLNTGLTVAASVGGASEASGVDVGSANVIPAGGLVITEFMANPSACPDANGEWVEVFNNTQKPIALAGLTISEKLGHKGSVVSSAVLKAGKYATLGRGTQATFCGTFVPDGYYDSTVSLSNSQGALSVSQNQLVIDAVNYSVAAAKSGRSWAFKGVPNAIANDVELQWASSDVALAGEKGSPGAAN